MAKINALEGLLAAVASFNLRSCPESAQRCLLARDFCWSPISRQRRWL